MLKYWEVPTYYLCFCKKKYKLINIILWSSNLSDSYLTYHHRILIQLHQWKFNHIRCFWNWIYRQYFQKQAIDATFNRWFQRPIASMTVFGGHKLTCWDCVTNPSDTRHHNYFYIETQLLEWKICFVRLYSHCSIQYIT